MDGPLTIHIDDQGLPACHRAVLAAQLRAQLAVPHRLVWVMETETEAMTEAAAAPLWPDAPPAPARALSHLLRQLAEATAPFVWLSGAMLVTGPLADPFTAAPSLRGSPGLRLPLQDLLLADPRQPDAAVWRDRARALLGRSFNEAIDTVFDLSPMPEDWHCAGWHYPQRGALASARRFADRPWLDAAAPGARLWEAQLQALLADGTLTVAALETDAAAGLLRRSTLWQVAHDFAAPAPELRQQDAMVPHAARRVSPERLHLLRTVRYAAPRLLIQPERPRELPRDRWLELQESYAPVTPFQQRLELLRDIWAGGPRGKLRAIGLVALFGLRLSYRVPLLLAARAGGFAKARKVGGATGRLAYKRGRALILRAYHLGKYAATNPGRACRRLLGQAPAGRNARP